MNIEYKISEAFKLFNQKEYEQAAKAFEDISTFLKETDSSLKYAELCNNASVAYLLAGNPDKAYQFAKNTHLIFEKANDLKNAGLALGNQATAQEELGNKNLAYELYQQAADFLDKAGDKESRAYILKRISSLQIRKGKHIEALGNMSSALQNLPELTPREKLLKKLTGIISKLGNN
jgi:tetratricopeptide (TPR) repeat protein